jgi:Uma2 family endonuclease
MSSQRNTRLSPEEYLAIEREAEFRSEYRGGEIYSFAGASRRHNRVVTNITITLGNQLRDRPCNAYANNMRVLVSETGLYAYPDVVVTCGEERLLDDHEDTLLNPIVVIEVHSTSTEAYDRGKRFAHYRQVESLRDYLLIAQGQKRIECFTRQEHGQWLYAEAHEPDAVVRIESIGCDLALSDVYAKVDYMDNDHSG